MACANEERCFTVTWDIKDFGLFMNAENAELTSTVWKTETTEGSALWWCLRVIHSESDLGFILFCSTETLKLDLCKMSLISSCGEVQLKQSSLGFQEYVKFFIKKKIIYCDKKQSILPQDTLTLCCKMWEKTMKNGGFRIHSVLHRVEFLWNIERPMSHTRKTIIEEDDLKINMTVSERENGKYSVCAAALPTINGYFSFVGNKVIIDGLDRIKMTECVENSAYNSLHTEWRKNMVIRDSDCDLILQLQSIVAHHNDCQYQIKRPISSQIVEAGSGSEAAIGSLSDDLLHLYREGKLSDATLNTEGKSFPAHRNILAARSRVFGAMFEKDQLSEGRSGVVDIEDVDSETVDRMLVFLYGDSLGDVRWEEASALYYAADKYAVLPLKKKCVDILIDGLATDNVCDALVLADKHSDGQMMRCAVDFVCDHQEVISSPKWEELEDTNLRLTSKITKELLLKKGKK